MSCKIVYATVAIFAALNLFAAQGAIAAPMLCSGEQKTCIAACQRIPGNLIADCIAGCRARQNYCKHTGCWDNGTNRYCGLLRQ
jgi:hypothetical protein